MSFGKQRSLVSKTFLPRGVRLRLDSFFLFSCGWCPRSYSFASRIRFGMVQRRYQPAEEHELAGLNARPSSCPGRDPEDHDSPKDTQCRRYQQAAEHGLVVSSNAIPSSCPAGRDAEDHDSPTDTQCHRYQQAAKHEPVSTRDPAHVPVVIRVTTTRQTTHSAAGISRQQNMNWWSQATRDPAHVLVVMRRTMTRRPTHSATGISRQQNMDWSQRETQLMSWS
jgi:hypothetical protein